MQIQSNVDKSQFEKRFDYAVQQFEENGIRYHIPSPATGHFQTFDDDNDLIMDFWCGTGRYRWHIPLPSTEDWEKKITKRQFSKPHWEDERYKGITTCVDICNRWNSVKRGELIIEGWDYTTVQTHRIKHTELSGSELSDYLLRLSMGELEERGIDYNVCNADIGHINLLDSSGKVVLSLWTNTGKVYYPKDKTLSEDLYGVYEAIQLYEQILK